MIYQPPAGARDLLPLEVEQKRWINDRLQRVFQTWGYQRIVTSTLEWVETLTAGGAIEPATVIQLRDSSEHSLGLRPEVTASIARAAVTRMAGNTYPQRLCYRANVFRNPPQNHHGRQLEFYQAGVELLFAGGYLADGEIILLLANCLEDLGISNWSILLGEAELTRSLLAIFPPSLQQQVRHCIVNLDRVALENLNLDPALKTKALSLFDLRGNPQDVLAKITALDLDDSAKNIVENLQSLFALLDESSAFPLPITLDLSLLQTIDYYTGIIFKAVSFQEDRSYVLGKGGRYDRLLGLYHPQGKTSPGIGFSLSIEELHSCLLAGDLLPQQAPASDYLIISTDSQLEAAAFKYARKLRLENEGVKVEIELRERSPEKIREYARACRIPHLVWIAENAKPQIETLN